EAYRDVLAAVPRTSLRHTARPLTRRRLVLTLSRDANSSPLRRRDLAPHRGDRAGVVGAPENRRARDENIRTRARDAADVIDLDAAVDLEPDREARAVDQLASRL